MFLARSAGEVGLFELAFDEQRGLVAVVGRALQAGAVLVDRLRVHAVGGEVDDEDVGVALDATSWPPRFWCRRR